MRSRLGFVRVPSHVGIRGNLAAESAAKNALNRDTLDELSPFSDLQPRLKEVIHHWVPARWVGEISPKQMSIDYCNTKPMSSINHSCLLQLLPEILHVWFPLPQFTELRIFIILKQNDLWQKRVEADLLVIWFFSFHPDMIFTVD